MEYWGEMDCRRDTLHRVSRTLEGDVGTMLQHEKKWDALFCNDPNHDYALTMEISHGDDIVAIVRCRDGRLMLVSGHIF
jgi:hypothetical protein